MFGRRKDGKKLKKIDPIIRLGTHIMKKRNDADIQLAKEVNCEGMDNFIKSANETGEKFTYMHIVIASIVRMLGERPRVNRFVMSGRVYSRNKIYISFVVKTSLTDDSHEATVKIGFTGYETLSEIKQLIDQEIAKAVAVKTATKTDKLVKSLFKLPHFILSPVIGLIKLLDRFGALPKSLLEASPFHTSVFLTNMKSLRTGHLMHHIYNFGTTGIFVSMGKESMQPIVNLNDEIVPAKIMMLGLVIDERVCDGFYYAKSLKLAVKYMENPSELQIKPESLSPDPDL